MALTLDSEQQMLKDNARQFVRENAPVTHLRKLRDTKDATGFSPDLWRSMVELGWSGIVMPEAYGGMGLGYTELGVVLEECGRNLVAASAALERGAVRRRAARRRQRSAEASAAARHRRRARPAMALAFEEIAALCAVRGRDARAKPAARATASRGNKTFVLDGHVAEHADRLGAHLGQRRASATGITLFLVDAGARGVKLERTTMVDSRNAAKLQLEAVEVPASAVLGQVGKGADVLDPVLDRATICAQRRDARPRSARRTRPRSST